MSLTGSYVIAAIILARLLLKKAPKIISYVLWAVAGFRLIFPFSFESVFSLIPFNSAPIPADIAMRQIPRVDSGIPAVDNAMSHILPAVQPDAGANPLQICITVGSYLWLFGIAIMLIYSLISVIFLKWRLKGAILIENNIYEADNLKTPFVLGLFKPMIYIPHGLSEKEKHYILLHERTHIRRHDYIVKLFAYFILCLHWYNPLVWAAFRLMVTDMEMSCDERVLKELGKDIKKEYSATLLSLAAGQRLISSSPLAFGEGNIKSRIKNVLSFKKPAIWGVIAAIIFAAALIIGFATNRANDTVSGHQSNALQNDTLTSNTLQSDTLENSESNQISQPNIPNKRVLEPTTPEWSPKQSIDTVGMPELDYASNDIIIFHGYFGLFVYDLESRQFIRSLDLKPLNCDAIQGDDYCEVTVSKDGNTVQLHRLSSENMYVYTVSDNTLYETKYERMNDRFGSNFVPIEDVINSQNLGNYSYNAVKFDTGEYGYLHIYNWTLDTLSYVRGDMMYDLFN
jgi:beta-lactamase regulating signal transducer with metallopeptidase domain